MRQKLAATSSSFPLEPVGIAQAASIGIKARLALARFIAAKNGLQRVAIDFGKDPALDRAAAVAARQGEKQAKQRPNKIENQAGNLHRSANSCRCVNAPANGP